MYEASICQDMEFIPNEKQLYKYDCECQFRYFQELISNLFQQYLTNV